MQHNCPYCSGEMKPCGSMTYRTSESVKIASWVRCVRCQHATVVETRGIFDVPFQTAERSVAVYA